MNAPSLPDLIEQSGRTWKTYQEYMPEPCFLGSTLRYVQKHNPFIYFEPIRLDAERCAQSIVPLTQLEVDIASKSLPNFIFITPDICHSAHDCALDQADVWLKAMMNTLVLALDETNASYLIILTWDEGQGNHSCCGLPEEAGAGRIATVLISPQVKTGFQDDTPYSHYSILKTIAAAWGLALPRSRRGSGNEPYRDTMEMIIQFPFFHKTPIKCVRIFVVQTPRDFAILHSHILSGQFAQ